MDESVNQFPEQAARDNIDRQFHAAGWAVQDKDKIDWNESIGITIRGNQTEAGTQETNMKERVIPVQLANSLRFKNKERGEYTLL